jgi:hypothetical protein
MNPFVIYNKETTRLVHGLPGKRRDFDHKKFATYRAAQSYRTRMVNLGEDIDQYGIADEATFYQKIEKTETKRNLLSGKDFTQPVNTPLCCDPSSETYWSM